jgi:hypothetical protein
MVAICSIFDGASAKVMRKLWRGVVRLALSDGQ